MVPTTEQDGLRLRFRDILNDSPLHADMDPVLLLGLFSLQTMG